MLEFAGFILWALQVAVNENCLIVGGVVTNITPVFLRRGNTIRVGTVRTFIKSIVNCFTSFDVYVDLMVPLELALH